jgi:CxxC motif-containing protein
MKTSLTCIECPIGCQIEVEVENGKPVSITGYTCLRGKSYAESEVICPRRVVTSTVKATDGTLVPVKTERPVKKSDIFAVMQKINKATVTLPVKIGDIVVENISEDIHLIATGNA